MKVVGGLNPTTKLYFEMLKASRDSLSSGRISFLGQSVDRTDKPLRFWFEWAAQSLLLIIPILAVTAMLALLIFLR
jgi:hypothetical protein